MARRRLSISKAKHAWRTKPAHPCPSLTHAPPSSPPLPPQVVRLSSQDVPTSYAYELESATIVQPEAVEAAVRRVVGPKSPQLVVV